MGIISVDSASVVWLGAESERLAETVDSAAPAVPDGFSATSVAVQALHSDVEEAARRIARRLQLTGQKVSNAAQGFAAAEAANEDLLNDVRPTATTTDRA